MSKQSWAYVGLLTFLIVAPALVDPMPVTKSNEKPDAEDATVPSLPSNSEPNHLAKVEVSGLRLEAKFSDTEKVVLGHNRKHHVVIVPNSEVRVVLFGSSFQEIGALTFTSDGTCKDMEHFYEADFSSMTNTRLVVEMTFPKTNSPTDIYKLCVSEKFYNAPRFAIIDDPFSTVTTEIPPAENVLPMWLAIISLAVLLGFSGLFSGLNLGLMTLSPYELLLYIASGTESEKRYANKILPVRKKGNQLLCTLVIGNVVVNVGVSMLMDIILGTGVFVLIGATASIVVFGEIVPQAVCVKLSLPIGAKTIPITRVLLILMYPITWPISKILDMFLKEELTQSLERNRLVEMLKLSEKSVVGGQSDEFKILLGALEMYDKTVTHAMTRYEDVFMLPDTLNLSVDIVTQILDMGYTRIPIYENKGPGFEDEIKNVTALFFVKDLALLDPEDNHNVMKIASIYNHEVRRVHEDMPLRNMLEEFKRGDYHMALVERLIEQENKDPIYELCGLITLEDIIEEIIQCEIIDETDAVCDNVHRKKRHRKMNHDMSQIVNTAHAKCAINVQMLAVTIQVMSTCHKIFTPAYILPTILQKLILKNCKKVDTTQFSCLKELGLVQPKPAVLYKKGQFSNKFIMILSGRAVVTVGKEEMRLEAGAWHSFGTEMLDAMTDAFDESLTQSTSSSTVSLNTAIANNNIGFMPEFDTVILHECIFCEISTDDLLLAINSSQIINSVQVVRSNSRTSWMEEIPKENTSPTRNGSVRQRTVSESETVKLLPNNLEARFKKEEDTEEEEEEE